MFKNLNISPIYSSYDNELVDEFYNPIFKNAVKFDRISAYFSAKTLALYAKGIEHFVRKGHKYRLIISQHINEEDYLLIKQGYKLKETINLNMLGNLREKLTLEEEKNISNLAYLISIGIVEIKIAFVKKGIFHDKCGIFYDEIEEIICFRGSNNETASAIASNYECFTVTCSWLLDSHGFYKKIITKSISEFEKLWNNKHEAIIVLKAEDVIMSEILKYNKNEIILEEILLEDNCVILDYTDCLLLRINMKDNSWITKSPFYKLRLKRYVDSINESVMYFKETLSYIDFKNLHNLIKNKAESIGVRYFATKRLLDYIEFRNIYIEKRSNLGIDIKRQDEKLRDKFKEFSKVVNRNMSRELREKQMWDSFFMFAMAKSANFSVPGSGKTSSVLGVYAFLKAKSLVNKIVMIGPKNAFGSWVDEFNICFKENEQLKEFNIHGLNFKSSADRRRALNYDTGNCNLLLFNYECLGTYKDEISNIIDDSTLLVFDEVHKVKRVEGDTPGTYATNALDIARKSKYTVVMTGTPIPNSYTDLYNMFHILYNDEYEEFFGFSTQMLRNLSEIERKLVNDKIQPFFCRTTKNELSVPPINDDEIILVNATPDEQKLFKIIKAKYRNNRLALFIRLLQFESNPKMLLRSLDSNEFKNILEETEDIEDIDYCDYSQEVYKLVSSIKITSKMINCINLIKKLVFEGKRVITWCIFIDSINNIEANLKACGIKVKCIYGAIELNERFSIINQFRNGEFDVLITNPHTLAESVSLHSVCHDAVYFEYSYNLVHLLQSKDRIHRLGLPENQYTQYYYIQINFMNDGKDFSIDEQIYSRLMDKEKIMLEAIDNNELEYVTSNKEDLDLIFGDLFV
ncbi:DEAD/DEAH box helicase family protein [Clostridium gasigenes]|uniref:SNF2-related protein n=1 Tax=Clostridium gasigenes TaxID=94869 RepID=UPI001C0D8C64|nr:SNF2-related protein [Clostridium gasigenes]MBU3131031.1 DEAD/DEAH box helicase family protein [Clostridium gasigenes]